MSMYGANPDQLANLGNTLTRQIDSITQMMSARRRRPERHHLAGAGPRALRRRMERQLQAGARQAERGVRARRARLRRARRRAAPRDGRPEYVTTPSAPTLAAWSTSSSRSSRSSRAHPGPHVLAAVDVGPSGRCRGRDRSVRFDVRRAGEGRRRARRGHHRCGDRSRRHARVDPRRGDRRPRLDDRGGRVIDPNPLIRAIRPVVDAVGATFVPRPRPRRATCRSCGTVARSSPCGCRRCTARSTG